ncbi:phage major tail tube protein [Thermoanaerobacterium thermosaccharolyticum]|jgi:P2 family phage contractile tail tube protein|uniref:phage major tail tube protein n=1 Tax=Thermoanaerobacterium thermosaccharolyticum TaxID=1517 RepID=UPI003D2BBBB5
MSKLTNKTINYRLKATDENGVLQLIDDLADVQLPSIEKITDTIKGAGIMGEIDLPVYGQIGSMTFTVNNRADNPKYAILSRPGAINFEVVWVNDIFDSTNIAIGTQQNKVFMIGFNKKYEPGKIEVGAASDGSSEFEIIYYRKIVDGKEVLLIDKLNYKYVVNGKDYMNEIRAALS